MKGGDAEKGAGEGCVVKKGLGRSKKAKMKEGRGKRKSASVATLPKKEIVHSALTPARVKNQKMHMRL
jgi:hypothetical protein